MDMLSSYIHPRQKERKEIIDQKDTMIHISQRKVT